MAELSTTYPAAEARGATSVTRRVRGLSDRTIAWLFVGPVLALLLAINIFPLLWNIYLSFTNYRANLPDRPVDWFGLRNYERLLTSEDVWGYMQVTAHFVFWTMFFEMLLGFGLAWLINRQFRARLSGFFEMSPRKVIVDPLGRIRWAND
jgi:multiple sugar transport system permease protein